MTALRLGSLCTGYGGLDAAVGQVLDVETVWHADPDPGATAILAHHWPDVPNLGDITATDWTQVPPVDVLTAGYPCQPFSLAGRQKGLADDRHIWPHIATALRVLRPRIAIFENVPGHLRLGFDAVLADLAALGFDAEWCLVRADEVGAPHRRERLFLLAWLEARREGRPGGNAVADTAHLRHERAGTARHGRPGLADGGHAPADAPGDGRQQGRPEPAREQRGLDAAERGGAAPADAECERPDASRRLDEGDNNAHTAEAGPGEVLSDLRSTADAKEVRERAPRRPERLPAAGSLLTGVREHEAQGDEECTSLAGAEAPGSVLPGVRGDGPAARSPRRPEPGEQRSVEPADAVRLVPSATPLAGRPGQAACGCAAWAKYAPAIHWWEHVLGRQAPPPTEPTGKAGAYRLSPRAVEFMMGLPSGHVTSVPGLTRTQQLRALGNGVVPQQGAAALRLLLERSELRAPLEVAA